jgi:hypothetical protein
LFGNGYIGDRRFANEVFRADFIELELLAQLTQQSSQFFGLELSGWSRSAASKSIGKSGVVLHFFIRQEILAEGAGRFDEGRVIEQ